jgi:hypothetical protein
VSHAKQSSDRKRLKKAAPVLGAAAGLSLSLASGASAAPALHMPTPVAGAGHEIILAEEEISDVSLATFFVYDKESTAPFRPNIQLARGGGGCGGGGCRGCGGGGCGGCGCRGCAGCGGCGGWGGCGGCAGFWPYGGCGGCVVCAGCAPARWGVAPPPPTYFYPPPGRPPLTRLRPVHKDEGPVEIPPVSKDPAPNATSTMPTPLHAAPATPAPATTPARPPSPPGAAPGSIQD